jgi:hypothetical protein
MNVGTKIGIVAVVAIIAIAGAVYFLNSDQGNNDKNHGQIVVTVSNMNIGGSIPVKIYIDSELVQDTSVSSMGYTSGSKKVSWAKSEDRHSFGVNVVYIKNGVQKTETRNVMVESGRSQLVSISI